MKFHTVFDERISKDDPISFEMKEKPIPSRLHIEPEEIQLWGASIPVPEMTAGDFERLSDWTYVSGSDSHRKPSEWGFSNAFSEGFVEIEGLYYFGLQGGWFEAYRHMGGLVVCYPLEKKIEVLRSKYLVACSILDIKQIGKELALATADGALRGVLQTGSGYWEEGEYQRTGLVIHNMDTKKWRKIPFSVPQTFIREMAVIDDQVWMTTNLGISRYDPESGEMSSWELGSETR